MLYSGLVMMFILSCRLRKCVHPRRTAEEILQNIIVCLINAEFCVSHDTVNGGR